MIDQYDSLEIYCPQMGTMMTFNYCRRVQSGLPCRNAVNCWETRMPIGSFLKESFTEEALAAAFGGLPKTRLERIFACVEESKKDQG
ncbi:MAG: hypothetical protein HY892_08620 [Deltaproteobacteria bacterium]|nr:hypothetical protein [Deltaproteobacteria bacterium]